MPFRIFRKTQLLQENINRISNSSAKKPDRFHPILISLIIYSECSWAFESRSDVEPFRNISLLEVKHFLFGLVEVLFSHLHSPLSQGNQPSLRAHGLNVCSREVVFGLDQVHCGYLRLRGNTSSLRFILEVWIWKILCLVLRSGTGNSIFLSILPGLISAGSNVSILFVAMITLTSACVSNPSSWFSSSNIVLCTSFYPPELESYRFVPIASISSMKMIAGECSWAVLKSSRTSLGPSPKYFWISYDPTTLKKVAEVSLATAFASKVFPVPGSP